MKKGNDEEIVTVITAVAAAALGYKAKVKKITLLGGGKPEAGGWSLLGKMDVMASHNVNIKGN
jgi:hypothetical protein